MMMLSTRTRPKSGGSGGAGGGHEDEERIQLFRPSAGTEDVDAFLDRVELTDDEIISFLKGEPMEFEAPGGSGQECDENDTVHAALKHAFHARRAEIRQLSDKLAVGEARIDEDGRLRPTEVPQHPNANLPPGPQPRNNNNDNNGNDDPPLNHGLFGGPVGDRQEAEVERMVEQETREAAASIARAVQRYRDAGVPEEDFEVILIEPRGRATANLTFRRICIAVLAVVTAFVCVILQTLPLLDSNFDKFDPDFDKLMYDLLHVRFIKDHAKNCPGLNRLPEVVVPNKSFDMQQSAPWFYFAHVKNHVSDRLKEFFSSADLACDDGVLHFPAKQVLLGSYLHSANAEEAALTKPFASGVNVSWFFPCQPLPGEELLPKASPVCMNSIEQHQSHEEELLPQKPSNCFRGVHDDIVSDEEIDSALRLGNNLIVDGGDHFTIHYDVSHLQQRIPTLLEKLQALLHENYHVAHNAINPVAFRVYTVGPMDAHGVNLYRSPSWTLNRTNYMDWVNRCKRQNEMARYSLPWPFRVQPVRDTCNLMADMEADPQFAIHTTVFLNDGAGVGYRGGVSLYADYHRDNSNSRRRVRRGISIDGSRGRVVISTGGIENRRCRLPTRAGLRTSLQIWWKYAV